MDISFGLITHCFLQGTWGIFLTFVTDLKCKGEDSLKSTLIASVQSCGVVIFSQPCEHTITSVKKIYSTFIMRSLLIFHSVYWLFCGPHLLMWTYPLMISKAGSSIGSTWESSAPTSALSCACPPSFFICCTSTGFSLDNSSFLFPLVTEHPFSAMMRSRVH